MRWLDAADGGILNGEDILGLNLRGLELVVLSACDTGADIESGGQRVFGLQQTLHAAGANNVVASLWPAPDDSTAALMALFHHQLWQEKQSPLQALRQAQLYLYHHPEQINDLAKGRGSLLEQVTKVSFDQEKGSTDENPPVRAAVKQWAGFLLSGTGGAKENRP